MTREEAIKLIDTHTVCFYNEIDSPTLQALHLAIEALSVVRCKDCRHWDTADGECYGHDHFHCSEESDYCSHGERREP